MLVTNTSTATTLSSNPEHNFCADEDRRKGGEWPSYSFPEFDEFRVSGKFSRFLQPAPGVGLGLLDAST